MYNYYNNYSRLKPKQKAVIREREYFDFLSNLLISMVNFNGFPDTVNTKNLNLYRMFNGSYGVTEYKGDLIGLCADASGLLDFNGDFIDVKMTSIFAPLILDRKNGKNCVVGYNNSMRTPDQFISRTAHMLAQTDLSMVYNLFYARLNKAFATDTEETTREVKKMLNGTQYGEIGVVTSTNIFGSVNGMKSPIQEINLTDVKDVDKLQYLSNFHWDIMKRFLWAYGIPMAHESKQAQLNSEEIESSGNGSTVLLFDIMRNANEFCDKVNKLYGLNTSATLGDSWEMCLKSYGVRTDDDGVIFENNEEGKDNDNAKTENVD